MDKHVIKTKITPILANRDVVKAGLFGSYADGLAKSSSDVDLLVEFNCRKSLYDLVGLKLELEAVLKKPVDLLTYKSLSPLLKDTILKQQQVIYERL